MAVKLFSSAPKSGVAASIAMAPAKKAPAPKSSPAASIALFNSTGGCNYSSGPSTSSSSGTYA